MAANTSASSRASLMLSSISSGVMRVHCVHIRTINQGYNITRQVQELPEEQRDEAAAQAVELEKAKKEIQQADVESNRRHKIAGLFCKAFERAARA